MTTNTEKTSEEKNNQMSFEIGYIPPFWSSKPIHKYSLDVWREGVISENIDLSRKDFYLIGRNAHLSDIPLENLTVSRAHCIIQNKDDGDIFLYDLDSVYGTYVNKSKIPTKSYIKLSVGDTFNIGKSSKMFILNGPDYLSTIDDTDTSSEFKAPIPDKKELLQKRIDLIKEQAETRENHRRNLLGMQSEDTDWGQKDYDEEITQLQRDEEESLHNKENRLYMEDYYGTFNLEELKERKDLNDKQRNMIHKIENLLKGIKNIKEDMIRIKQKENDKGEITEGQKKRLQSNEAKINDLNEKLENFENNLRVSLASKDEASNVEHKFDKNLMKELDSEDEYYDRTKKQIYQSNSVSNKKEQSVITENYETLKVKLEALIKNRQRLVDKLQNLKSTSTTREKQEGTETELDSLDAFISETNSQIASQQKTETTKEINDLTNEINKTQKLLSLVTPSHLKLTQSNNEINIKEYYKKEKLKFDASNSIVRDQGTLDKEKSLSKKKNVESIADTMIKIGKIKRRMEDAYNSKKFTDSDEEIMEEVDNFKDIIAKEVEKDEGFRKKVEEFKKTLIIQKNKTEEIQENQKGGLILDSRIENKRKEKVVPRNENIFGEIVQNLKNSEFNIDNYSDIRNVIHKKKEERTSQQNVEIDYSKGGLQTFNNYLKDQETNNGLLNIKREREVYGATKKPQNRNMLEEDNENELNDFDAIYTVGEKISTEHDISSNPFRKYNPDNDD